jgi:hypothetical protein
MRRWLIAITTLAILAVMPQAITSQTITLDVFPKVLVCTPQQMKTVRVLVRITPDPANTEWDLAWISSANTAGKRTRQIDETSPKTHTVYVDVYCATYLFQACVYQGEKKSCVEQLVRKPEGGKDALSGVGYSVQVRRFHGRTEG